MQAVGVRYQPRGCSVTEGLFARLDRSLSKGWGRWSLNLEGEDPRHFLFDLVQSLKGTGADNFGKKIENRHRYIGLEPTLAWMLVSTDPSYPVTYDSKEAFARLWDACMPALDNQPYHYVSLGIGTGDKDRHVLDRLLRIDRPDLFYVPVDISGQMLRLGTAQAVRRMPGRVLPIEMNFEDGAAVTSLRDLLDDLTGGEPVLFSLLGNSLANVDDEPVLLRRLTRLLRPQDRLALEVAITRRLDAGAAQAAAHERSGSRLYNEFVTAALHMHTDLTVNTNWLRFHGSVEQDRAVRVEGYYVNCSGETISMMLPNRETVPLRPDESIQVLLGRKYLPHGLRQMLSECQLEEVAFEEDFAPAIERTGNQDVGFGLAMMLLRHEPQLAATATPLRRVWQAPAQPAYRRE